MRIALYCVFSDIVFFHSTIFRNDRTCGRFVSDDYFFVYENKDQQAPIAWAFLFSGLTVASYFIVNYGILKTAQPLDVLCVLSLVMYAFIFRIRNLKIVRFTMLIPTILSILFNVLTSAALFTTLTYVFEFFANVVTIFKYHILGEKQNRDKGN